MANRHLARSIALQTLFEIDFREEESPLVDLIIERNIKEFGPGLGESDQDFARKLATGVYKKRKTLDAIIEKAAHDWPVDRTPLIDRNVLRIGLHELLFASREEVPARVAINESIELAKQFGGDKSGKFVNGVIGTIYKEMGEPGKDEAPKKKNKGNLTPEEMAVLPVEEKVGAVIYFKDKSEIYLAFVHDIFGHWTLSKGALKDGEGQSDGLVREVKEETNVDVQTGESLKINEYIANHPEKGKIKRRVSYYLAEAQSMEGIKVGESGGLNDARWFNLKEISVLKMYEDIRPIINMGVEKIKGLG